MNTIDTVLAVIISIFILCVVPVNFKKKTYDEAKRALLVSAINENAEDVNYVKILAANCGIRLNSFVMTLEGERETDFYPYLYYKDTDKTDLDSGEVVLYGY